MYANDIGSRFFLCINCTEDSNKALSRLSALVDESLADFGLETFYAVSGCATGSVSITDWCVGSAIPCQPALGPD